jgi:5'-3' exonuclease
MGVVVWPMVELEADDALASAAHFAAADARVEKVCIWTPDKDLAQCVVEDRVVQMNRRTSEMFDAAAVKAKFGVVPALIPDFLALVGDSADGYPGLAGYGEKGAAAVLNKYGPIEHFPPEILGDRRADALLFKKLATLVADAPVLKDVDELRWRGAPSSFRQVAEGIDAKLATRAEGLRP